MKPEKEPEEGETEATQAITGDVIGDTAYSERFVLKLLLKFANLDTLKDEIKEKSFEDELCTLWDMTAERDVVLFLSQHNALNLFNFALPTVEPPRIVEIILGIIGNMCCHKEVVHKLFAMKPFLTSILDYMKTDDSLILIQVLRLISSCLFVAETDSITSWMELFVTAEYSSSLYFILNNSSNKDLLITALENFNTATALCNTEECRKEFFTHFVTAEALEALTTAFTEIVEIQKTACNSEEIERCLVISLQICLNLIGFDKSLEVFEGSVEFVITMIGTIFTYYEKKLMDQKNIDTDLIDVIDSTITIVNAFKIGQICSKKIFYVPAYKIYKIVNSIIAEQKDQKGGSSTLDDSSKEEINEFAQNITTPLCTLLGIFMNSCSDEDLKEILEEDIKEDYENILTAIEDKELKDSLTNKTDCYNSSKNSVNGRFIILA